jgi:glutaminyl-peptide cyclotransferase
MPSRRTTDDDDGRGTLRVRPFVILLAVQLVLIGGLLYAASRSFDFLGFLHPPKDERTLTVPQPTADRFDAPAAMALVRRQLAFGPRPAGSPQLRRLADELRPMLPAGRFEPVAGHPRLRNIVGELPGRMPALVVGAHYDTDVTVPDFVGANDGAAGTAAVVELSRSLRPGGAAALPAGHRAVRFVLFDGEEAPRKTDDFYRDALRGSKAYVRAHPGETQSMVLLDYMANAGLRLPREGSSDADLWQRVRQAAHDVGVGDVFPDAKEIRIIDDHTPFLRAGVPSVDLIDWAYPAKNSPRDTYDELSARAMDATGETMALFVQREAAR